MHWLNDIVNDLIARCPQGTLLIESGSAPSGVYHLGHLRELIIADAILLELRRRGREARHIQFVDDFDAFRKVPLTLPPGYKQYLGQPLCDIPAPDSGQPLSEYFLQTLADACSNLGIEVDYIRASQKYREGFYAPAIERSLERLIDTREALVAVSGRELDESWSPIQILEGGKLQKRKFLSVDKIAKTVSYESADGEPRSVRYDGGLVKLDWRLDWPGRWWLQHVDVEPSGRDHMTKGGSYDTGVRIMHDIYGAEPPYPVSYDFINMVGDTKKMSASQGTGLDAVEGSKIMPPEVVRYFILRAAPLKRLYFDPVSGLVQLMDEFAALAAKVDKTDDEKQLWYIATRGGGERRSVARVPFSHLVACYQASLKDADRTLEVIRRTEHASIVDEETEIIKNELKFIEIWLEKRAPDDVKFSLAEGIDEGAFSREEKDFLMALGGKIALAPKDADGEWFHETIYALKDQLELKPKLMFTALYRVLIGRDSGPRAGWFLSILPREWLVRRLRFEG